VKRLSAGQPCLPIRSASAELMNRLAGYYQV
jgi:hypothetical protein